MTNVNSAVLPNDQDIYRQFVNPELADLLRSVRLDKSFVRGQGTLLRDSAGLEYLDFVAGYGSVPFGHNNKEIWDAVLSYRQGGEPGIVQPSILSAAAELAERLISLAPPGLARVCFSNSGAEAIEVAIKACRVATGRLGIVAADNGFHGKTLGALSATGAPKYQKGFGAPAPHFHFVPYGDAEALDIMLNNCRDDIAAVILEPIQGEGGVVVPPPGYLAQVREITACHDVRLILDEVQTGLGRTGTLFASAAAGVQPDCLTVAKALGGGLVPVGACLFASSVWSEDFALRHSSTFAGNALACRVGLATLKILTQDNGRLLRNVEDRGRQLATVHADLCARFPNVLAQARGHGLLLGLAFNVSRESFPAEWGTYLGVFGEQGNIVPLIASYLLNVEGIRSAPTLNGSDVLRVEPPLSVTEAECDRYIGGITRAVDLLAQGITGALAAHLVDTAPLPLLPRPRRLIPHVKAEPRPDGEEGRFAFIVHPLDTTSLMDFDASLKVIRSEGLMELGNRLTGFLEPFPIGATRIKAEDGSTAFGEFICVPRTAREMQRLSQPEAQALVSTAVDLARDRGASIVGLGGYTSVVTLGGTRVLDRNVAITTGNSYTLVSAIEAVELACQRLGIPLREAQVAVVGAGGAIGAGVVGRLIDGVGALTLVGRPNHPEKTLRRFEAVLRRCVTRLLSGEATGNGQLHRRILAHPQSRLVVHGQAGLDAFVKSLIAENGARVPLRWSLDLPAALAEAEVIVCVTNSAEELIHPEHVRPGAVLCDMSRPSNVSRRIADERPDVLVLDGGIVNMPGRPDFGFDIGIPRGLGYACLAETMMLGLSRQYRHTSIGADLAWDDQRLLTKLAHQYGFRLSGLRGFDRLLSDVDWRWLRQARQTSCIADISTQAKGATSQSVTTGPISVRQNPDSLLPGDRANASIYLLERHLETSGDKVAVIDGQTRHTYRDLYIRAVCMASLLRSHGVVTGDMIALVDSDSIDCIALLLGAMRIGATLAMVNPDLPPDAILQQLHTVRPVLLLAPPEALAVVSGLATELGCEAVPLVVSTDNSLLAPSPALMRADTPAICLFSSGTTGRPKAVLHSHRDILNTNLNYAKLIDVNHQDVVFTPSRTFFAYGVNAVLQALFAGATSILAARRTAPETLLPRMQSEQVTLFFAVPTIYLLMLERQTAPVDLSALRLCVSAGEPLPVEIYDAWMGRFGIELIDGIGCTETLSTFLTNTPANNHPGSLIQVVPGFEVRLLTETGQPAAQGEVGTLCVRGNTLATGYFRDPVTTDQVFTDGWFNTNDLFVRDGRGHFTYIGRAVETFKVGGMWVSPQVIESMIARHPAVLRCAVVRHVDFGKLIRPKAFVVPHPDATPGPALAAEIKDFVRRSLARHLYPHIIEFIDELPVTATGKIQRHRLMTNDPVVVTNPNIPGHLGLRKDHDARAGAIMTGVSSPGTR